MTLVESQQARPAPVGEVALHGPEAIAHLPMERVNSPQPFWSGFGRTIVDIWRYRELLVNLTRKELKVKYKGSFLGFAWSLVRPLLLLAVYYIAIGKFLGNDNEGFIVFLFSGLTAWFFFSDVVNGASQAVVANGGLIKKVWFPREILPLSVIGAALVQFLVMIGVLVVVTLATGRTITPGKLLLLPLSIVVLVIFATALALLVSAANVYLRDTQHLIEVLLLLVFYLSPILYSVSLVLPKLRDYGGVWLEQLFLANPMAIVAMGFQDAIYQRGVNAAGVSQVFGGEILYRLLILGAVSCVLLFVSQRVFARAQGNFAQEL